MKRLLMLFPLLLAAGGAAAMERYDMTRMSCAQIHAKLESEGAALLMSPSKVPGMMKFDKYVVNRSSCGARDLKKVYHVKTADGQSCVVYKCQMATKGTAHL